MVLKVYIKVDWGLKVNSSWCLELRSAAFALASWDHRRNSEFITRIICGFRLSEYGSGPAE